jgi:CDGSH-type Zn-finger protein
LGDGRYRLLKSSDRLSIGEPQATQIKVLKDGPYLVSGEVPLFEMIIKCSNGTTPSEWVMGRKLQTPKQYILCRCGKTKTKPFCDGTHYKTNFDGTETSDNKPFEELAKVFEGPKLDLKDAVILCASARFCHRGGDIWEEIPKSDDPKIKQNSIRNACDCPSGRLVVLDKEKGNAIEPSLEPSIGAIIDPRLGFDGPYWIRGGIPVYSSEGKLYEVRNRMTLCRCGNSANKPFCDSSHYPEEYQEVTEDERK